MRIIREPREDRFQFSENTLFAAGFDRPTVEAFRHLLKQVGALSGEITLPQAATEIESLAMEPAPQFMPAADVFEPARQMTEQIEFLQTEVRSLAEQVATLTSQINDIKQGTVP